MDLRKFACHPLVWVVQHGGILFILLGSSLTVVDFFLKISKGACLPLLTTVLKITLRPSAFGHSKPPHSVEHLPPSALVPWKKYKYVR